jgi:hypothetical protein
VLDGNVLAIDELDDDPVAEDRFLLGHWHTFFVRSGRVQRSGR